MKINHAQTAMPALPALHEDMAQLKNFCKTIDAIAPRRNLKLCAIKINRLLGWALLFTPLVQLIAGISFLEGLRFNAILFILHALISIVIFGLPKAKSFLAQHGLRKFFGGESEPIAKAETKRALFLFDTWRILVCIGLPIFLGICLYITDSPIHPLLWLLWFVHLSWLGLRLPISTARHICYAIEYALKRWNGALHLRPITIELIAEFCMIAYLIISFLHFRL